MTSDTNVDTIPGTLNPTPATDSSPQLDVTDVPHQAVGPKWPARRHPRTKWTTPHTLGLAVIIAATVLLGLFAPPAQLLAVWVTIMLLLLCFAVVAGHGILGLWTGLLIDERNRMSLSRLQMLLWTVIVLSGFLTAALWNIRTGQVDSLAITVPEELWLLMGIATTSLIGSPLILNTKIAQGGETNSSQAAHRKKVLDSVAKQGKDPDTVSIDTPIVGWKWPEDATWADLFQGEEIGNATHLDLGKVQMFYFTLILVLTYSVMLGAMFSQSAQQIGTLPTPPIGMALPAALAITTL